MWRHRRALSFVPSPFGGDHGDVMSETATDSTRTLDSIIEIAPAALHTVLGIRADEEDPDGLGLRIEITGTSGVDFTYDLAFDELANAIETDEVFDAGGITVVVPAESVDRLRGSVLDVPRSTGQGGLVIRNPNRPNPLEGVELDLDGSVADRVQQLLDQSINPSLASHDGF